jgi:hypothetical protein
MTAIVKCSQNLPHLMPTGGSCAAEPKGTANPIAIRPHSSLNYSPPAEALTFVEKACESIVSAPEGALG